MAPPLPPPAPSLEPAAAFLQRLAEGPAPAVRPLEPAFQPLAAVVAGTTDVRIATGPTVARALGEVGRRAATVGRTIHLAQEPRDAPADLSVLGHELAHVGAAGVRPRFLGGPPDAEERRAHRVAGVVDAASRGGTRGLRVGSGALAGRTVHRIVQRAVDEALRRRPAPETTRTPEPARPEPKAAPVQQVVQFAPSTEETVVRRSPVIQRGDDPPSPGAAGRGVDFDRILEALEERVLSELERRGGRLVEVI